MTHAQSAAYRIRWVLLVLAVLCWLAGVFWLTNVVWPEWEIFPGEIKAGAGLLGVMGWWFKRKALYLAALAAYLGVFIFTQWLFLLPRGQWRLRLTTTGRPMRIAVLVAALMAGVLSMGLVATVMHCFNIWSRFATDSGPETPRYLPPVAVLLALWAIWAGIFWLYWRQGDRYTQLGRMIRGLIAGSILELLIAGPAHIWVNREGKCYCIQGSYTGLVFGSTVLLWCFGPGLYLLFLREAYRRQTLGESPCLKCGYDLRGSLAAGQTSCPECGQVISGTATQSGS